MICGFSKPILEQLKNQDLFVIDLKGLVFYTPLFLISSIGSVSFQVEYFPRQLSGQRWHDVIPMQTGRHVCVLVAEILTASRS